MKRLYLQIYVTIVAILLSSLMWTLSAQSDQRTRVLVEAMRADEARHRETALRLGAVDLPRPVRLAMRLASGVMTRIAHRV